MLRVHVSKNKVRSASTKLEVDRRLLQLKGRSKVRKLLTGYSLKPGWLFVMGYPWGFDFLILLQAQILVCLCKASKHCNHLTLMAFLFNQFSKQKTIPISNAVFLATFFGSSLLRVGFLFPTTRPRKENPDSFIGWEEVREKNSLFVKGSFEKA